MARLILVHWNEEEAKPRLQRLRKLGYEAAWVLPRGSIKELARTPPDRYGIDLTRRPSTGLAIAIMLLQRKSTRGIPVVFLGGKPDKVQRARQLLPGAAYVDWEAPDRDLRRAIDDARTCKPPAAPPGGSMALYAKSPLARKLGIDENTTVVLMGAPDGFGESLGIQDEERTGNRVLLFVRSSDDLVNGFDAALRRVRQGGGLWIMWPKKTSGVRTDVTQYVVRALANESGWADYKICSVDATWSGMLFGPART